MLCGSRLPSSRHRAPASSSTTSSKQALRAPGLPLLQLQSQRRLLQWQLRRRRLSGLGPLALPRRLSAVRQHCAMRWLQRRRE